MVSTPSGSTLFHNRRGPTCCACLAMRSSDHARTGTIHTRGYAHHVDWLDRGDMDDIHDDLYSDHSMAEYVVILESDNGG